MNFFKVKLKSKSPFPGADSGTPVPAQGNKKPKIQNLKSLEVLPRGNAL